MRMPALRPVPAEPVIAAGCTNDVVADPDGFFCSLDDFSGIVYPTASGE